MQRPVLDRLCEVHVTPWTASSMCQLKVKHVEHGVQDVADDLLHAVRGDLGMCTKHLPQAGDRIDELRRSFHQHGAGAACT